MVISRKLRAAAAALLTAALTSLAAGCASGGSSSIGEISTLARVSGLEKTTLNVSVVPAMDSAGFFVALHDGLFAQEGLRVIYTPATSSETVIQGQVKGQYDITGGNYVSYIQAQVDGEAASAGGLQIIDEGSVMEAGAQVVVALPKSHITTLPQLQGRFLAVNAPNNIDQLLAESALIDQGININKVHFSPGIPFPFMPQALKAGFFKLPGTKTTMKVDAAVLPEPFASLVQENLGGVTVADLDQGATSQFAIEGYVATRAWVKANPNTLRAFLTALNAGQEIADTNRAAVEQAFEALNGAQNGQVNQVIASMMALDTYPLQIDATRLQRVADVMQQFGVLHTKFNVQTMLG